MKTEFVKALLQITYSTVGVLSICHPKIASFQPSMSSCLVIRTENVIIKNDGLPCNDNVYGTPSPKTLVVITTPIPTKYRSTSKLPHFLCYPRWFWISTTSKKLVYF